MADPRDIVDISYLQDNAGHAQREQRPAPRPWIGVLFECCNVYARIHKTADGSSYSGFCPKCNAKLRVGIGQGGTSQRIFRAS